MEKNLKICIIYFDIHIISGKTSNYYIIDKKTKKLINLKKSITSSIKLVEDFVLNGFSEGKKEGYDIFILFTENGVFNWNESVENWNKNWNFKIIFPKKNKKIKRINDEKDSHIIEKICNL